MIRRLVQATPDDSTISGLSLDLKRIRQLFKTDT